MAFEIKTEKPPIKIEKSLCDGFIRVSVGDQSVVVTLSEWSKTISHPGLFNVVPPQED